MNFCSQERRQRGKMSNQVSQGSTAEKHNGVQGPAALEKGKELRKDKCHVG